MTRTLVLASAGAGKTQHLISEAIVRYRAGKTVLIIAYTENNQTEIKQRIAQEIGAVPDNIKVKGWFTFLLEDLIRPYQRVFFEKRIENVNFNDSNPHILDGQRFQIRGRQEFLENGQLNYKHFLTKGKDRAHTTFLSKLAVRISEAEGMYSVKKVGRKQIKDGFSFKRIGEIFDCIILDEAQDVTGWDYEVLAKLSQLKNIDIICVGDLRQTIYLTHHDSKKPNTNADKLKKFEELEFERENLFISHRCVQSICDFADGIHAHLDLPPTISKATQTPGDFQRHIGVFIVRENQLRDYCRTYQPTILRDKRNVRPELCKGNQVFNFGQAKGLGFNRTLIIPTPRQKKFLSGDATAFKGLKTDRELNRFYVAVTRAKFSVAFLSDNLNIQEGTTVWKP